MYYDNNGNIKDVGGNNTSKMGDGRCDYETRANFTRDPICNDDNYTNCKSTSNDMGNLLCSLSNKDKIPKDLQCTDKPWCIKDNNNFINYLRLFKRLKSNITFNDHKRNKYEINYLCPNPVHQSKVNNLCLSTSEFDKIKDLNHVHMEAECQGCIQSMTHNCISKT